MTNNHIVHYLTKYADPQLVVQRTETTNTVRSSYYPATYGSPGAYRTISTGNC